MHLSTSLGVFLGLLLCLSPSATTAITVDISGSTVVLWCLEEDAQWHQRKGGTYRLLGNAKDQTILENGTEIEGEFRCSGGTKTWNIYVSIKACDGCVDLSLGVVAGIVASDLLITLGVLLLVYYCSKRRAAGFGGGAARGSAQERPRGQKADCPPPIPNPDYEPIRKGHREVYAGLEPRGF